MIWGEAGVGKTTFASKLAQDWAEVITGRQSTETDKLTEEQRHLLSNIGLVLYIVFRDTHEDQSLDDIVQSQAFDMIGEKSVKVSQKEYQKEILLLCDGLDEVNYSNSELLDIINGRKYNKAKFIITCRPHASLGMSLIADAEIRLKGFSKKQAHHFVNMFFIMKYQTELAKKKANELWEKIILSPDLMEMAINPSMLQLLCKLFAITNNIAKDRATIFKDYTHCLLQHHHFKCQGKRIRSEDSEKQYRPILLKVGELALQGLKQSHLQLVFTKDNVTSVAGNKVYDIGFVTEIPSSDDIPKAQFIHKSLQEYLAAYFIVNSPDNVGMKYLMEFCSTSKGLMGSKIILTFITALSKKMGKVIQKQIRELVSSWASEDDVSPKDRTSFLLTMLKENRSLVFPLPNEIELNVSEYEANIGWFQRLSQFFWRNDTLEQFFDFDNRGVKRISIVLGETLRLQLLKKFHKSFLIQCEINFQKRVSVDDQMHLKGLIESNKKLQIIVLTELTSQGILDLFQNRTFTDSLASSKHLEIIKIHERDSEINTSISDALTHIPSHIVLDLSGNKFADQSGCKAVIQKAAHLESLVMQDCGIIIDTEIAEVISQLPEQANLDLSGNRVTKMDSSLLCHVIPVISNKKIDLSGLDMVIDTPVAKALCSSNTKVDLEMSDNIITNMDYQLLCLLLYRLYKNVYVDSLEKGTRIKRGLLQTVMNHRNVFKYDICNNKTYKQDIILALVITADKWKSLFQQEHTASETFQHLQDRVQLDLYDAHLPRMQNYFLPLVTSCMSDQDKVDLSHIQFSQNDEIYKSFLSLPENVHLDLTGHTISKRGTCMKLIEKSATLAALKIQDCGIIIDAEIAEAISQLPEQANLDLSGNTITKMDSSLLCHVIPVISNKKIDLSGLGVVIDEHVVKALCSLDKELKVDLSGNHLTDKSACITLIHKAVTIKYLSICKCGIKIDTDIAEAVSKLPDDTQLDLSGNQVTDTSACITLIHKAATMKSLSICNCGIGIDTKIAEAVSMLPDHTQLDLSSNRITDKSACITLIQKTATMKSLSICNCGIKIDAEIAEAVSRLPDYTQLNLSGNQVTCKSACLTLINKAATIKSLNIHDCMSNCGIQIDTEIAEAVSRLPDHAQLDLSGNNITKMKPDLLSRILLYMTKQKKINIDGWGIVVDVDIVRAVSKCSKLQTLIINDKYIYNRLNSRAAPDLLYTLISKPHLQFLFLDNCSISNDAMVALTYSLYKHCGLLEDLSLCDNHLSSGVREVMKHILQMKNLRRLWLSRNPCMMDYKQRSDIKIKLHNYKPDLYVGL